MPDCNDHPSRALCILAQFPQGKTGKERTSLLLIPEDKNLCHWTLLISFAAEISVQQRGVQGTTVPSSLSSCRVPPAPPTHTSPWNTLQLSFSWKALARTLQNIFSRLETAGQGWGAEAGPPSGALCMGTCVNGLVGCLDFPHIWPSQFPVLDPFPSSQISSFLLSILAWLSGWWILIFRLKRYQAFAFGKASRAVSGERHKV